MDYVDQADFIRLAHVLIDIQGLLDPIDQKVTVGGIRRMRELFQTHALAPVVVSEGIAPTEDIETDEQILNYAKSTGFMNWHAACTCKMGVSSDPLAVVDSKANVIGVSGLRVVDASSFALLPPVRVFNTMTCVNARFANISLTGTSAQYDIRACGEDLGGNSCNVQLSSKAVE